MKTGFVELIADKCRDCPRLFQNSLWPGLPPVEVTDANPINDQPCAPFEKVTNAWLLDDSEVAPGMTAAEASKTIRGMLPRTCFIDGRRLGSDASRSKGVVEGNAKNMNQARKGAAAPRKAAHFRPRTWLHGFIAALETDDSAVLIKAPGKLARARVAQSLGVWPGARMA